MIRWIGNFLNMRIAVCPIWDIFHRKWEECFRWALCNRGFCDDGNECSMPVLYNTVATSYIWLLNTWNVDNTTEEMNFYFNKNNHMWLVFTIEEYRFRLLFLTSSLKSHKLLWNKYSHKLQGLTRP